MLPRYLSQVKELVKDKMLKSISNKNKIEEAMAYSALADSKMIRAGLVFASSETNKNIVKESIITLSSAVELMHTYSLIHDDLPCMDDDDLRRNQPSSHIKYGEANAVLAGDALGEPRFGPNRARPAALLTHRHNAHGILQKPDLIQRCRKGSCAKDAGLRKLRGNQANADHLDCFNSISPRITF